MIKLNKDFKQAIKSIIFEHYDITCHKIDDITNYAGGSELLIYSLNCTIENEKATLYLHMPKPTLSVEVQEISFKINAQYNSVDLIKNMSKKLYKNRLNICFENLNDILKPFGLNVYFSINRSPSVSLANGTCCFKDNQFKISNFEPLLYAEIEIYAYSKFLHSQVNLCDFVIYGSRVELTKNGTPIKLIHEMSGDGLNDYVLVETFLKFYIALLKNRHSFLQGVFIEDVENASIDDLKNMITVFTMERI
jgi:hypothetical protein